MLVLNTANGLPGQIGLHVRNHVPIASHTGGILLEKPDQELAPTLLQLMVVITAEGAKMMLIFATTMYHAQLQQQQ